MQKKKLLQMSFFWGGDNESNSEEKEIIFDAEDSADEMMLQAADDAQINVQDGESAEQKNYIESIEFSPSKRPYVYVAAEKSEENAFQYSCDVPVTTASLRCKIQLSDTVPQNSKITVQFQNSDGQLETAEDMDDNLWVLYDVLKKDFSTNTVSITVKSNTESQTYQVTLNRSIVLEEPTLTTVSGNRLLRYQGIYYMTEDDQDVIVSANANSADLTVNGNKLPDDGKIKLTFDEKNEAQIEIKASHDGCKDVVRFYTIKKVAANTPITGKCDENIQWSLLNGELTISGEGAIKDFSTTEKPTWSELADAISSVKVNEGITRLGNGTFRDLVNLQSIALPTSLTEIGESVFSGCSKIQSIAIPDGVTMIGDYAFFKCTSLKQITLPSKLANIPASMLSGCKALESIAIPDEVTSVGDQAFSSCVGLKEVIFPANVTSIGAEVLNGCTSITKVVLPANITSLDNIFPGMWQSFDVLFRGTPEQWNLITGRPTLRTNANMKVFFGGNDLGDNSQNAPIVTEQPQNKTFQVGAEATNAIQVKAAPLAEGEKYLFIWYQNTSDDKASATLLGSGVITQDGIGSTLTPATEQKGTQYYYCMVEKIDAKGIVTWTDSDVAAIAVKDGTFKGSGMQTDPYLLSSQEDLNALNKMVADGQSMEGVYFELTNNITLPADWTPIGKTIDGSNDIKKGENLHAFSGVLDGKNYTVTVPEGGYPLFGYVKGAQISNLNIYGTKINGYGLINNLEGVGLSGSSVVLDHITLKSGSSTLKSGLLGANVTTNGFAGCSADFLATIKNCTIESGVVVGYGKDQEMIGGIAGRMQGDIINCVSHATVYGTNYVGGIVGTRDNAMGSCKVENCTFDGAVVASGTHAGGIVGGGYSNSTAPNGIHMTINQCTASGSVTGADKVGGILGGDSYIAQAWNYYTMKGNSFTGTVKATDGNYVGGIIGYYFSLNKMDDIAHNSYSKTCGADKGIGFVQYVDTNCAEHETTSGTIYINTEKGITGCPVIKGCDWKAQYNRSDDPIGADAAALTSTEASGIYVTGLQISGEYKKEYYLLEELDLTGMVIQASYSDGTAKEIPAKDVTITGFDNTTRGEQTLTVSYEGAKAEFTVKVKKEAGKILISFQLLGDALHSENGTVHTLTGGNLTSWIPATSYTVDENDTVYDIMKMIAEKTGFKILARDSQYGTYIEGIEYNGVTLKEFDNGKNSGWMYTVNGKHPEVGVDAKYPSDGDVIVFHYTDDYTKEEGNPHEHSWGAGVITKAPTCTEAGVRTYTCECGESITESIPATRHKYGAWTTTTEATVFAPAVQTRTCSVCGSKETQNTGSALQATIKVNANTVPLKVKQKTSAFKVTGLANGDSVQSYKSSNTKIFTVTKNGVLKAGKKTGKATLTIALASGLQKKVTVKVQKKTVTTSKITGLQKKVTLKKGAKLALKPSLAPITSTQKFTYSSSNKKIATVNKKGVITGKKAGKTKITVKSGKKKYTVTVTVTK